MTFEELDQLQALDKMIEYLTDKLENVRSATMDQTTDQEIRQQIDALQAERSRLEAWIIAQPPKIQLIVRLRFVEGYSWEEVADELYNGSLNPRSGDAARMRLKSYLRRQKD